MSLAQKTLSGFIWTLTSRVGTRISIFVVGIILARLLTPADFGLVAMLSIFFSISSSLVDSGFTHALIREETVTEEDKTTVFYINIIISISLYTILWFSAPYIAFFFDQPQLIWLTRIMGLDVLFKALIIVQRAVFMQSLRFKLLSTIDISVSILTGIIAIFLAYKGMGVWALAIKYFLSSLLISIILFIVNPWMPSGFINKNSFDRLFGFGSKLLITGLINVFYNNIYNLVIGKLFSPAILGFYNRAYTLTRQPVTTILIALQQVTYPILSKTKDDLNRLKFSHQKVVKVITFINFPISIVIAFSAEPLVVLLLGEKWIDTVPFLQLLSISALVIHLSALNKDLFKVIGRSNIYLKISIISKVITTLSIIIGYQFGIWGLVIGSIVSQFLEALLCMYYSSKYINYSLFEQLKDILLITFLTIPLILTMLILYNVDFSSNIIKLLCMLIFGITIYLLSAFFTKSTALSDIKEVILPYIKKRNKK